MTNRLPASSSVGFGIVVLISALLFPSPARCQESAAPATNTCFQGPFDFMDGITFYIANRDGVPFTLKLKSQSPFLLVRVFDPEERLLFRKGFPDNVTNGKTAPFGEVTMEVPARGKGVYQVVVTENRISKDLVAIATTPALPFGVFGHPILYAARPGQFAESYVYLPPGLPTWNIAVYQLWGEKFVVDELVVRDEQGGERLRLSGKGVSGSMELPKEGTNVWRMSVKSKKRIDLYFGKNPIGGDPIILCPDPETARFIHASVDRLEDGTICYHKFQVRAHEILKRYRQMPAYKFLVPIPDLNFYRASILREPLRNEELFVSYGALSSLAPLLEEQNLDPQSPWFGSMYGWRGKDGKVLPGNPFSDYSANMGMLAPMWLNSLAVSYALDAPFNPLYKNEALLNRLIVGELFAWMSLKETEFLAPMPAYLHYGSYAFWLGFAGTPAFPLLIRDFPEDAKEVYTDACRRLVDRMTFHCIANNVNQWTVGMGGFIDFYKGTGEDIYLKVLLNHLQWMYTCRMSGLGQMPAGYMAEANGPDSTYNGITGFHLAMIYHELKDLGRTDDARALLKSLRRCYFLFNHTVAPEPNGVWLGACSFCCRTPGDWTGPQVGAGLVFMGDDLPEAAAHAGRVWHFPKLPANDEELVKLRETRDKDFGRYYKHFPADHVRKDKANLSRTGHSFASFDIWKHFPSNVVPAKLPMEAEDRFERDFGGEFYAIRRPAYYALFYAAATAAQAQPKDPNQQFQRSGGLCLFWSKDFGTSLLGKNWSTYTAHSLITVRPDGKTDWEELKSIKSEFKKEPTTLTINGRLRNLPLRFQRVCTFPDDRVDIVLTIEAEKAVTLKGFNECFPYPLEKPGGEKAANPMDVTFLDQAGEATKGPAQAVAFRSGPSPEAHLIVFDSPRSCKAGAYEKKHGRVLASLPLEWKEGERKTFRFSLIACKAAELKARVQKAMKE